MFLNSENPDIFCCTETWLSLDSLNSLFCPAGYHVIRYDRDSRSGRVILILKDRYSHRVAKIPNEFFKIEIVCADISTSNTTFRIIVYYRYGGFDLSAEICG